MVGWRQSRRQAKTKELIVIRQHACTAQLLWQPLSSPWGAPGTTPARRRGAAALGCGTSLQGVGQAGTQPQIHLHPSFCNVHVILDRLSGPQGSCCANVCVLLFTNSNGVP